MSQTETSHSGYIDFKKESQPSVFQCKKCFQIVGDSNAWVISHREYLSFTLSDAVENSVRVEDTFKRSDDGLCVYSELSCTRCNEVIGKVYNSTPIYLDDIRDMYTFSMDKLQAYQLGNKT
nr:Chain A, Kinetochore protein mis18 [Schizosaccharomyces pombe]5HJ0_B Chain B, Kinetochore protein mis18 [Schizosaccharomyces pombe]5HJ0_C Chain C, Kinetochore protein mis18 [Schizosaccharomyces pombe]